MAEKTIEEIVKESLDNVRALADTQTVVGQPISIMNGVTVIPVSRVSVGLGLGGSSFGKQSNHGAGGGSGVTITPVAFLIIKENGETKILNLGEGVNYQNPTITGIVGDIDTALDKTPEVIGKVKALFSKNKSEESKPE